MLNNGYVGTVMFRACYIVFVNKKSFYIYYLLISLYIPIDLFT